MKITTLIPAYKTQYMAELLESLRCQTVKPDRIIISDDSPAGEFRTLVSSDEMRPYLAGMNIGICPGPRQGGYENMRHLLNLWNGGSEFVHFLFDDDVIYPEFYEQHLLAHGLGNYPCSISRRWTANESGQPIDKRPIPVQIRNIPERFVSLDADLAFTSTIPDCNNWLGEFSNTVFRADACELIRRPPLLDGIPYYGLEDLGAFLSASLIGPICLIQEHLGYFRTSPHQNTSQTQSLLMKVNHLSWLALAIAAGRIGKLDQEQISKCIKLMGTLILSNYSDAPDMAEFCELLPWLLARQPTADNRFLNAWERLIERFLTR